MEHGIAAKPCCAAKSSTRYSLSEGDRLAIYDRAAQQLPMGRGGEVTDCARAYVDLVEQEFGTGVVLTVDGGTLLV